MGDWEEVPGDLPRSPQYLDAEGWTLYHWNGLSWKWVLCHPCGGKIGFNSRIKADDSEGALAWAQECKDLLQGEN